MAENETQEQSTVSVIGLAPFVFSGSREAFATHRSVLASLGNSVHLGADPTLASVYDTALFGLAWGALAGYYHAVALVGAAGVDPTAFAAVATGHMPFVTSLMTDHARQIEDGRFPDDDCTVEVGAPQLARTEAQGWTQRGRHGVATCAHPGISQVLAAVVGWCVPWRCVP